MEHISETINSFENRFALSEPDFENKSVDGKAKKNKADGYYSTIYHGLSVEFNLSPTESLLLAQILSLSKERGYCFASQSTLAHNLNLTETTINSNLQNLLTKGLIGAGSEKTVRGIVPWRASIKVKNKMNYIKNLIEIKKSKKKL